MTPADRLVSNLLLESQVPRRFTHGKALRKPESLPKTAEKIPLSDEEVQFLDSLECFEIDGENLYDVELPPGTTFCVLIDFNTKIPWLSNSEGYNYPRYVLNINGYTSDREQESQPLNPRAKRQRPKVSRG